LRGTACPDLSGQQSHTIGNLYVKIASPFVPQCRNDEKPLIGVDSSLELNEEINKTFSYIVAQIKSSIKIAQKYKFTINIVLKVDFFLNISFFA